MMAFHFVLVGVSDLIVKIWDQLFSCLEFCHLINQTLEFWSIFILAHLHKGLHFECFMMRYTIRVKRKQSNQDELRDAMMGSIYEDFKRPVNLLNLGDSAIYPLTTIWVERTASYKYCGTLSKGSHVKISFKIENPKQ